MTTTSHEKHASNITITGKDAPLTSGYVRHETISAMQRPTLHQHF